MAFYFQSDADKTLTCFVQTLRGKSLTVELRDNSFLVGLISSVDESMNVAMNNVVYEKEDGTQLFLKDCVVKSRHIRYIHIPKINVKDTLNNLLCPKKVRSMSTKLTAKKKKQLQNQDETRARVNELLKLKSTQKETD